MQLAMADARKYGLPDDAQFTVIQVPSGTISPYEE